MPNTFSSISLLLVAGEISASPQVWAVVFHEAPGYYHRGTTFTSPAQLSALDGIFNYTVSYRSALAQENFAHFAQKGRRLPTFILPAGWRKRLLLAED